MRASTDTVTLQRRSGVATVACRPLIILAITLAAMALALSTTLVMPIGPMYWDQYIYLDAANRIFDGQMPSVDFFTPVGSLGYYLFAGLLYLFPNGSPLLLSSWALVPVTAPLMALVVMDVEKQSVPTAYALLLPFLLFSVLPFNAGDFYPYPGSDGFGIYNRHICQLLYVLAAALVFVRGWKTLVAVTTAAMLALLFTKVTGISAGAILCLMAFAAGRLPLRAAVLSGVVFFAFIGLLELTTGIVSAYATDIVALLQINDTSLLPRLLQAVSINFGVMLAAAVLGVTLLVVEIPAIRQRLRTFSSEPRVTAIAGLFDHHVIWLGSFLVAGLLFESQNTGSQAFIFLWPLLLAIIIRTFHDKGTTGLFAAIAILAIATVLPTSATIVQKAGRAWAGALNNNTLESQNLKTIGHVGIREVMQQRALRMQQHYVYHRSTYEDLAATQELPSFLLYSDMDFQMLLLKTTDEAVSAIRALEAQRNVRFETMMTIDFTNVFPWLMDRHAPKYIAIGADPYRAVPAPGDSVRDAVAGVDIALYPTCPPTAARLALLNLYGPTLASGHKRVKLTDCFDAFIRNELM